MYTQAQIFYRWILFSGLRSKGREVEIYMQSGLRSRLKDVLHILYTSGVHLIKFGNSFMLMFLSLLPSYEALRLRTGPGIQQTGNEEWWHRRSL